MSEDDMNIKNLVQSHISIPMNEGISDNKIDYTSSRSMISVVSNPVKQLAAKPIEKKFTRNKNKKTKRLISKVVKRKLTIKRKTAKKTRKNQGYIRRVRDSSISTNSLSVSSLSIISSCCKYCGHCHCDQKYKDKQKKEKKMRYKKRNPYLYRKKISRRRHISKNIITAVDVSLQAGSRSTILSPLCLNANPTSEISEKPKYCEVSPEMIVDSLKQLSKWKQFVNIDAFIGFMTRYYPVNPNVDELHEELLEKLRIATLVGFISQTPEGTWSLSHDFEMRKMPRTHVSLFWKAYADTLKPLARKEIKSTTPQAENETSTHTTTMIFEEYI